MSVSTLVYKVNLIAGLKGYGVSRVGVSDVDVVDVRDEAVLWGW
jgi:hypothetical protein